MNKYDPYNHKSSYTGWKKRVSKKGIPNIGKENSTIILKYLFDMERGLNVSSKSVKGPRGYNTLNRLRQRLCYNSIQFKELYGIENITNISEEQIVSYFVDMKTGTIPRRDGGVFKSVDTYAKVFKAFWHWWMKVNRKANVIIPDITCDIDVRQEKPDWVYLTEEEVRLLAESANFYHRTLIYFLYDTGIRSPTELMNIKVSDFYNDFKELNIRNEISKTFGRRIKLMICSQFVSDFIRVNRLNPNDFLFTKSPGSINRCLQRLAQRILGDKVSPAGQKYSQLTMYDFRHNSCCYWLPRYKSESALKYRFGWKKSDKIHYYSELLGMEDTIQKEDLNIATSEPKVEQNTSQTSEGDKLIETRLNVIEMQIKQAIELVNKLAIRELGGEIARL